jgi:hypothetical protein
VSSLSGFQYHWLFLALYLNSFPKSYFFGTTTQNGEVSSYLHNLIIDVVCHYYL